MAKYKLVRAFHPTKFEKGVYAVHFSEKGKPMLDKHTKHTQVKAKSRSQAIKKAKAQFGIK